MKALLIVSVLVASVVGVAAYTKHRGPGWDIRVPKMPVMKYQDRVPEIECPPGQSIIWRGVREIDCGAE